MLLAAPQLLGLTMPFGTVLTSLQLLQQEFCARESSKGTHDLGDKIHSLEERLDNSEAQNRNSRVWKLHHHIEPITAPQYRIKADHVFVDVQWEVHAEFPKTVRAFRALRYQAEKLRDILSFYDIVVYDESLLDADGEPIRIPTDPTDKKNQIVNHMDSCMEELAIAWGLDWQRIATIDTVSPESNPRHQKHPYVPTPYSASSPSWSQSSSPCLIPQMNRQRSASRGSRDSGPTSSYHERPPPPQYRRS